MPLLRRPALARLHAWTGVILALPLLLMLAHVVSGLLLAFNPPVRRPGSSRTSIAALRRMVSRGAVTQRLPGAPRRAAPV